MNNENRNRTLSHCNEPFFYTSTSHPPTLPHNKKIYCNLLYKAEKVINNFIKKEERQH